MKSWRMQFLRFQGEITGEKVTNKSYLSLFSRHSQRWILALFLSDRTWLMSCIWKKRDSPEQSFLYLCVRAGTPLQTSLPKPVAMNSLCNMLQEELLLERMVKTGHFFSQKGKDVQDFKRRASYVKHKLTVRLCSSFPFVFSCGDSFKEQIYKTYKSYETSFPICLFWRILPPSEGNRFRTSYTFFHKGDIRIGLAITSSCKV